MRSRALSSLGCVLLVVGCGNRAPEAAAPSVDARRTSAEPVASSDHVQTRQRIEIVEGAPVKLSDGTTLDVRALSYAHLIDGDNLSECVAIASRDGRVEEVRLKRYHSTEPEFVETLGWRVALDAVAAYHQPGHAWLFVEAIR
jgi:hypothetical protein